MRRPRDEAVSLFKIFQLAQGHAKFAGHEGERMSAARIIGMIAWIGAGMSLLLMIGPLDDRSLNWVNMVLAAACFASAKPSLRVPPGPTKAEEALPGSPNWSPSRQTLGTCKNGST
jgi:hypothetical protein